MRPEARALWTPFARSPEFERLLRTPSEFLAYLDRCGVERAVLVNYVSPDVMGYSESINEFASSYAQTDPDRLIVLGSVLPTHRNPGLEVRRLIDDLGVRGLKIHPPHQLYSPNGYRTEGLNGLREIYAEAERAQLPVVFHTGTSIFPRARNRFAQPLLIEDVAVDFPDLTIVLAHGGRPLWMNEALFLVRRFPNVFLEVSGVPPSKLLEYFPTLPRLADRVLFGSDWPGPGVEDIAKNLAAVRALPLDPELLEKMLVTNPERVFPRRHHP
jgi:predicted TIM-barrel fold metal-dependent hydrolase